MHACISAAMPPVRFTLHHSDRHSAARRGVLHTSRGTVQTPAFMPVGTAGTVKGLVVDHVRETGAEILLANTYHLALRPGVEVVRQLGGLLVCVSSEPYVWAPLVHDTATERVLLKVAGNLSLEIRGSWLAPFRFCLRCRFACRWPSREASHRLASRHCMSSIRTT